MQRGKKPFEALGARLRDLRRSIHESVAEVSGAVELETDIIASYECGETRPSEDVLSLLITHFDMSEDEADEVWELAGYAKDEPHAHDAGAIPNLVVIPMDTRVVYTDTANVSVNNHGVVMNFMQSGLAGQQVPVARVGMSMEHAKNILEVMQKTIEQAEASARQKQLPSPNSSKSRKKE